MAAIRLGITGGIGSGKSFVASLFQSIGYPVYISDDEAKRLVATDESIRRDLIALLGEDVFKSHCLNKQLLANYLFASKENAQRVNGIIHPRVKADFQRWVEEQKDASLVCMESAILIEAGFTDVVDAVVMVYAPRQLRIDRVVKRDGVAASAVEQRMASQIADEEKMHHADYVIQNDGGQPLLPQIQSIIKQVNK